MAFIPEKSFVARLALLVTALTLAGCTRDSEWPGYGGDGENHFSPLEQVNTDNVGTLGLQWHYDIETPGTAFTAPVEAKGVLYFASGLSIVHALDAVTGKLLWQFDTKVPEHADKELRNAWGSRAMTYANDRVFVGTMDGRLVAIDAKTGRLAWSAKTTERGDGRYITGAPWVYDNVVVIGHGGGDFGPVRGYVTAYDQTTGKQLWRFYTVPGDPAKGFENAAMKMAAKTWKGEWWKFGGGGTAWNAMAYDQKYNRIYIGTGNGGPWNQKVRSPGGGDNLFLCSIIALDAKTGEYVWHYQINPGETWDYNAAMDMALSTIKIDGKSRDVLMTAPKNGFFYVLDRATGKFISAGQIASQNWNRGFNAAGRPIENPQARYPDGKPFMLFPSVFGAHGPEAMSFSPKTGLAYIPTSHSASVFIDPPGGITDGKPAQDAGFNAVGVPPPDITPPQPQSGLLAWDPVTQKAAWKLSFGGMFTSGGTLATAGGLVFQGLNTGEFNGYDARSGAKLWSFTNETAIRAQPISYSVKGKQYITVLAGGRYLTGQSLLKVPDYRTERRRVLTFAIGGNAVLPKSTLAPAPYLAAPEFRIDTALAKVGAMTYAANCMVCHGVDAMSGGAAPHLLRSPVPLDRAAFNVVVREGGLLANGMPSYPELTDEQVNGLMHYFRQRARE
ncbi:PQQ-dependent dehydrogenase, methanol/ethanol family [Sphingorhabdus sp.]|jgi:quinohemoprotein ethanol dehydrogenase|uniref:PQQ-dependent dehydrogenase, methanol/ethanol family n=1 Tax=Sphingorhabdus sp. TaxID=1902408 RepID=UPI0037CAAC49